jgi:hypothetical protein
MEGWISLHRQVMDNEFYFSERFTKMQTWFDLLLLANHKPATIFIRGIEINLIEGQLCYSELNLAKRWKWNRKTVDKFLLMLKNRQMVDIKKSRLTTIITILKWNDYQKNGQQTGQQKDNRLDTDNNVNNGNKIITLAKLLIKTIKKDSSLYSIIGKYKKELGEDELFRILGNCVSKQNQFENENNLAGYLATCKKKNVHYKKEDNNEFEQFGFTTNGNEDSFTQKLLNENRKSN